MQSLNLCLGFLNFVFEWIDALPTRWKVYLVVAAMILVPILWAIRLFWFVKDVVEEAKKPWYGDDAEEEK